MTIYKVEIDESARNDLSNLLTFLKTVMSREGALRYIDVMVEEVQSLSLFAGLYQQSRSMVIRKYTLPPEGCYPIIANGITFSI